MAASDEDEQDALLFRLVTADELSDLCDEDLQVGRRQRLVRHTRRALGHPPARPHLDQPCRTLTSASATRKRREAPPLSPM